MKKPRTHAKKALMLLLGLLVAVRARRGGNRGYLTAYACEGTQLNISCETGRQIHLIRANYGRFSITICNEQGSLDWSVNCASLPSSYQAIKESCGMKQACVVPASSTIFGDPCPRTRKYLEAHYKCIAESTTVSTTTTSTTTSTTIANRPPIIIPVTHSFRPVIPLFHSSTTSSTENTPFFKSISTTASTGMGASPPSVSGSESSSKSPLDIYPDNDREGMYNPSRSVETTDPSLNSCPPTVSRNISWSWTRGGQDAIEPCPRGSIGRAKWFCVDAVSTVYWSGTSPDLSECQSPWAESLEGRIDGGESVVSIGTELAVIIRTKPLYGGDITQTLTILHRLVSRMEDRVQDIVDDKQKYRVILEMLHSVQSVASSLLEDFQHQAWRDMSILQQRFAASALIQRLEQNTWLLANTHSFGKRWSHAEKNILVSIRLVETWSITTVKFPQKEDVEGTSWALIQDIIVLSAPALVGSGRNGFVKIIFVAYKNVQDFLTLGEIHPVSTNTDDSQNSMAVNTTQIINSHVLSASIDRYRMVQLHQPVTVILKHLQEENVTNPQCVYWEFNTRRWSSDGCWITQTNKSHTGCSCNHLTNFALVMDVSPAEVNVDDIPYIQIVTIIGCGVAIFFLLVTFVTLHLVRGLKDDRHVIHKNMCFCLIVSEVTFVGGIDYVMSRIICGVVAGLLHYFFLASFIWMFLETFQLLLMTLERKDCSDSARRRWRWYCFSGYSVPIIAVSVCAIVDPESYGTKSYCWLEIDNYFIFGFVGPALACILMSIIFLCIVSAKIFRKIESSISCKSKEQSKLTNLRSCCQQCVCMLILLILTWGSAQWFLLWKTSLTVYLFTALNSLQGLLMFVLLCLRNPKVRKGLKKAHCCSQWLTECCRKPQNSQSNLYIHTNGLMILPQPSAISGHHILAQGSWRTIKSGQRGKQTDILDATTPVLPLIPMVGFRSHDHVVGSKRLGIKFDLGSEFDGENSNSSSTLSSGRKHTDRDLGSRRYRNDATASGFCSYTPGVYFPRQNHEFEAIHGEPTISSFRVRPRTTSQNKHTFDWQEYDTIGRSTCKSEILKQFDIASPNSAKSTLPTSLTSSTRPRHMPLFRDGYLRPHVVYSGINSPTDSERSFNSLVNDQGLISLSSSSSSENNSNASSPSHEAGTESHLLQSLPNLQISEEYGFSAFSNVLKFPSDNTALNANVKGERTQPAKV